MWRDGTLADAMPALLIGLAVGAALGAVYFGALWASVRQLPRRQPGGWFVAGLLARMAVAAAVLALVGRWGGGPGLLGALAGFILVRVAMLRRLRPGAIRGGPGS